MKKMIASVRSRIPGGYSISLARRTLECGSDREKYRDVHIPGADQDERREIERRIAPCDADDHASLDDAIGRQVEHAAESALGAAHSRAIVPSSASSAALTPSATIAHASWASANATPDAMPASAARIVATLAVIPALNSARAHRD